MIAGVAAGLGERFSINPWWFRIGLIALTVFGGFGLILYAIGWLLIPEVGSDDAILVRWLADFDTSNTPMMVGVGLIGLAALILAASADLLSGNLLLAGILLVAGVLLYRGDIGRSNRPEDPDDGGGPVPDNTLEETTTAIALEDPGAGGSVPPEEVYPVLPPEPPAPEAKPRSIVGQLTMAAMLVAIGGLALLDVAGILYPGFVHYVALALAVVGGGLLVGTFLGRARWLIAVGLVLVPVVLISSVAPTWSLSGETGDVYYSVATVQEIDQSYELAAGSLYLDLTAIDVEPGTAPRTVDLSIGAGEIRIDVPDDMAVRVEAAVGVGVVDLFGEERVGLGVDFAADTGAPPALIINADAGVGAVVVREVRIAGG